MLNIFYVSTIYCYFFLYRTAEATQQVPTAKFVPTAFTGILILADVDPARALTPIKDSPVPASSVRTKSQSVTASLVS